MSEEESFVILGSSPMASINVDGNSLLHEALKQERDTTTPISDQPASLDDIAPAPNNSNGARDTTETNPMHTSMQTQASGESNSLAVSFLLGEVNADALKNSVYSQFPSLCSMQACAEDVVKLQTMVTEYKALQQTLDKVNHTMHEYYKITQKWRQEANAREQSYQAQLMQCQAQVEKISGENRQLKADLALKLEQIQEVEEVRQKEHDELRQVVSEKTSLINNMRVEIDKLSQQQLDSYEFVPTEGKEDAARKATKFTICQEHEYTIKDLQRQMSRLMAENLEIKDMEKVYIDEINCLKANLSSAKTSLVETRADVAKLSDKDAQTKIEIANLQTQLDVYRRDFEMERADREKNAGEKEQYLQDLRALQRRNQDLIESLAEAHKANKAGVSIAACVNRSSIRDDQRPLRVLDPTGAAAQTAVSRHRCPICSTPFNSLSHLQNHVNDCLDKN